MSSGKIIIGSVEWCSFPQINIPTIKARIDSGAKTSALHAINIATFKKNNVLWASFDVHPIQDDGRTVVHCEAPVFDKRRVKSSSGNSELRYVIKTILSPRSYWSRTLPVRFLPCSRVVSVRVLFNSALIRLL